MSYWDRLDRYRTLGPQDAGEFVLRPVEEFNRIVGEVVDRELQPLGWSRRKGLRWNRGSSQPWGEGIIDLRSLKSGVGVRWGLRLGFVPRLKGRGARELDFSFDPRDYQRDVTPWALSRFATEEELREDARDLVQRVIPELASLDQCSGDLLALLACFETKKARKAVRLAFHQYPYEVLAYAAVLGLVGRDAEGLEELDAAFDRLEVADAERQKFRLALADLWKAR